MKLSVVIPVFNEANTISEIIDRVKKIKLRAIDKEIIVVDDGSTDGTKKVLEKISGIKTVFCENNIGKGHAVRMGMSQAAGDMVLIQDADLEYGPEDYPNLIQPILDHRSEVVYGSRFIGGEPHRVLHFHHYLANKLITFLSNLFTNLNLTDIEVGYKVFTKKAVETILPHLKSDRFGIEVELTARVAKANLSVYEVGISYHGRTYDEGKKINWKDGLAALWHILRFNLWD